jgi:phosphonate ABC transporter substrate-binding protein
MTRHGWMALLTCLWLAPSLARAQEVVVAVFVPTAFTPSAQARAELAQTLAAQLGEKVHRPARGVAFARARDLETAIAHGDLQAAVLDPLYIASHGASKLLASVRRGGSNEAAMIGVTRQTGSGLPAFRGKRLILPSVGGAEGRFVDNYVLEGLVTSHDFWSSVSTTPDAASAVTAVAADQADIALILDSPDARARAAERGLHVAFTTRAVPGPALAWVRRTADPELQSALSTAARAVGAGLLGDGWGEPAGGYGALLSAPAMPKPVFGAPAALPLAARDVVQAPTTDFVLPEWSPVLVSSPARLP